MSVKIFLPTRKGSERVIDKNTRPFAGKEGGLLRIKLEQLINAERVDEIILSTNDAATIVVAESINSPKITIIERPEHLCLSTTNLQDLIDYVPQVIRAEHILWTHVTSPLVTEKDYDTAIDTYFEKLTQGFDSLVSVTKLQQFLWDEEQQQYISHDRSIKRWPRTQDLKFFYELNSAMFISSRDNYLKYSDRLGENPYKYELPKLKSFDVDWQEDFEITEMIYRKLILAEA